MRNLLQFLAKHNRVSLFILLECLAVYLIINSSNYHNTKILKGVRKVTLAWEGIITDVRNYFRIKSINEDLQAENTALWNIIEKYRINPDSTIMPIADSATASQFEFISATVVNNSVNRQKNFFTIDKGKNDGVDINMAVLSQWGVAGITVASSGRYSVVMSLLNIDFRLSSKIKTNDYFGSLVWDGLSYKYAVLKDIPQHVALTEGDTVVTTGYSAIFPGGITVGTVSEFEKSGSDFYRIRIQLATDFKRLVYVTVAKNNMQDEQITVEGGFK
ncbi:MAG: rod shape-determining protein MreC [Bacteroidales bacterium]